MILINRNAKTPTCQVLFHQMSWESMWEQACWGIWRHLLCSLHWLWTHSHHTWWMQQQQQHDKKKIWWVHCKHPLKATLFLNNILWNQLSSSRRSESTTNLRSRPPSSAFKKTWVQYKYPLKATLSFCLLLSSSSCIPRSNITACHEQASKENWKSWEGESEARDWPVDPYHMSCICSPRKDVVLFVISICSSAHQQGMRQASKRKKAARERQRDRESHTTWDK